jgi:hypothetical protein
MNKITNIRDFLNKKKKSKLFAVLEDYDSQVFLYAKGHYNYEIIIGKLSGNIIEDLRILIAKVWNQKDKEEISNEFLYEIVYGVWSEWVLENIKEELIQNLFHDPYHGAKESLSFKEMIEKMIVQISMIKIFYKDREIKMGNKLFLG